MGYLVTAEDVTNNLKRLEYYEWAVKKINYLIAISAEKDRFNQALDSIDDVDEKIKFVNDVMLELKEVNKKVLEEKSSAAPPVASPAASTTSEPLILKAVKYVSDNPPDEKPTKQEIKLATQARNWIQNNEELLSKDICKELLVKFDSIKEEKDKVVFVVALQKSVEDAIDAKATASVVLLSKASAATKNLSSDGTLPTGPGKPGAPVLPGATAMRLHKIENTVSTAPAQPIELVEKKVSDFLQAYDTNHASPTKWEAHRVPTEKKIDVVELGTTDTAKPTPILTIREENDHLKVSFHEKNVSERAAMISLSSCESPVTIDSTSLEDLRVLANAAKALRAEGTDIKIELSATSIATIEKNNIKDAKFDALREELANNKKVASHAALKPDH